MYSTLVTDSLNQKVVAATQPRRVAIGLLFFTLLAGKFRLDRISPVFESSGLFGEVSFWIFYGFLLVMITGLLDVRKQPSYPEASLWWPALVAALHFYLVISVLWAPVFVDALAGVPEIIEIVFIVLLIPWVLRVFPEQSIEVFFKFFFWTSLIYVLAGFSGYWEDEGRMAAFWGGANVFVRIMASGLLVSFYLWLKTHHKRWLLPVPFLLTAALLSGSRGGMLALFVTFCLFLALIYRRWKRKYNLFLVIMIIIGTCSVLFYSSIGATLFPFLMERYSNQTIQTVYMSSRDILFLEAWNMFLNNPLCGLGFSGYEQTSILGQPYPHNLILQIAAEGGLVGLMILTATLLSLFPRLFREKALEHNAALCLGVYYFIASMFSGGIYDARFIWVFFTFYMLPAHQKVAV